MKLASFVLPTLLLVAACGDDSTGKPDFASEVDLSATDDMNAGDLKVVDQAMPDLTPVGPSGQIQQVRNMADTTSTPDGGMISLPVHDVLVTYLRPFIATSLDPAGFFVQADQAGPALFISVDPTTLSPAPQVGDLVRFNVTSVQKINGTRQAGSIDTWSVVSSGNPISPLVKDVTAATDIVTGLEGYESELIKITSATLVSAFASTGTGYTSATFTTTGIPTMNTKLKLRLPVTLRDSLDLAPACVVALNPTPLWRFVDTSEPSAWVAADISVTSCPAPQVVSAIATAATTIIVTFDRQIDAATLAADGSQFTFDNALLATAATLSGPTQVTVTTSAQVGGTTYTATVLTTLKDKRAVAIDAAHKTATFSGYVVPAGLYINELSLGITGGHDIIELKVTTPGTLAGFKIYQDYTTGGRVLISTLPSLIVATNDYVLVHLDPLAGGPTTETTVGGKTGCVDATCSATAWDVNGSTTSDFPLSARIVNLVKPDGVTTADAFAYVKSGPPAIWPAEMKAATMGGAWLPAVCPNACATATDATGIAFNVGTTQFGTTFAGNSAQRMNTNIPSAAADWQMKAGTLGADN